MTSVFAVQPLTYYTIREPHRKSPIPTHSLTPVLRQQAYMYAEEVADVGRVYHENW